MVRPKKGGTMEAREAARIFHDWAYAEGLMPEGPFAPVSSSQAELALVQPVTDVGKQLLRAKNIQSLAFSRARSEIVVFTKKVAPQSKNFLEAIPTHVDDIAVKYRQGAQHPIGPELTQPFGGPPYVIRTVGQSSFYTCGGSISVGNNREAGTLGCLVRPLPLFSNRFLALVLTAPVTIQEVLKETRGTVGQDNLSLEQVRSLRIPFISLEEQQRIVVKVDALMALCDRLEASLTTGDHTRRRLLDALLAGDAGTGGRGRA
jgi:hypothetical protein